MHICIIWLFGDVRPGNTIESCKEHVFLIQNDYSDFLEENIWNFTKYFSMTITAWQLSLKKVQFKYKIFSLQNMDLELKPMFTISIVTSTKTDRKQNKNIRSLCVPIQKLDDV